MDIASRRGVRSVGVSSQLTLLALCVHLALGLIDAHQSAETHPHQHGPIPFPEQAATNVDDDDYPRFSLGWDVDHIKADLGRLGLPTETVDNWTEEKIDFYFFTLHDFDNNTKLDGNEIIKALTHSIEENVDRVKARTELSEEKANKHIERIYTVMFGMVDKMMEIADSDFDGYITYAEFMTAKDSHVHEEKAEEKEGEDEKEGGLEGKEGSSEAQKPPAPQHVEQ